MASKTMDERLIPVKQYATPISTDTIAVGTTGYTRLFINPAATIALLTINLPSNPTDGDTVEISSSQIVTALTMGNGTILNALTALAIGVGGKFIYESTANKWFRFV